MSTIQQQSWASPIRLFATAITAVCIFALAGCGSGGGSDASTPSTPTSSTVIINGISFDTATSAATETGLVTFPTTAFQTQQYNLDNTLLSPQRIRVNLASATERLAGIPTTRITQRYSDDQIGEILTSDCWYAKATDGTVYMLKKYGTSTNPLDPATSTVDFTVPGQSLFLVAPATPVIGASYHWTVTPSTTAPQASIAGKIVSLSAISPLGVTGCIKIQRTGLPDGLPDTFAYVKPGIGFVEWTNNFYRLVRIGVELS